MDINNSFILTPVAPFRLDFSVWALRRRKQNVIDNWDGQHYTRVFNIADQSIKISVQQLDESTHPAILVSTHIPVSQDLKNKIIELLTCIFSLDLDLKQFYRFANKDPQLKPLVQKYKGMKPPCFPTLFETLCNAVACQQLSLDAGISLLNKFAQAFGNAISDNAGTLHAFPEPQVVKSQNVSALRQLGFSLRKSETIVLLAKRFSGPKGFMSTATTQNDTEIIDALSALKGIGRWSSEYALLRGLGRFHLFPQDDIGAHRNFKHFLHIRQDVDNKIMQKIIKKWHPYAGLIYFHLLLKNLDEKGNFKE